MASFNISFHKEVTGGTLMEEKLLILKTVLLDHMSKPYLLFTMLCPECQRELHYREIIEQTIDVEKLAIGIAADVDAPHYGLYRLNSKTKSFEYLQIKEFNGTGNLPKEVSFDTFIRYIKSGAFYTIGVSRVIDTDGKLHLLDVQL